MNSSKNKQKWLVKCMTMEQVLRDIKRERGLEAFGNGEVLVGLFKDFSKNQLRSHANALKVFVSCQGNTRILNLQNAPVPEQQVQFCRLVQELTGDYNMQEETALEICRTFWQVALESAPPAYSLKKSVPDLPALRDPVPDTPQPQPTPRKDAPQQKPQPKPQPKDVPKKKPDVKRIMAAVFLGFLLLSVMVAFRSPVDTSETSVPTEPAPREVANFPLDEDVAAMLQEGTQQIFTYPDGSKMEFYYNDAEQEICRAYVNTENEIEYLFKAQYDSQGRLVFHWIYDGEGNLLRTDSYDFHSSDDTAQRRVELQDGTYFQGVSTFDENGYETFTVTHEDGTRTEYQYQDGGILAGLERLDTSGNVLENPDYFALPVYIRAYSKVYGPWQTVIGWIGDNNGTRTYVQGLCGGVLKEYTVSDDTTYICTYDVKGNLLEELLYYQDGQVNVLGSHDLCNTVYSYDRQGNYTGYTKTLYLDTSYHIEVYDQNGIKTYGEYHTFNGDEETVSYRRYITDMDDLGREIRVQTFDDLTGWLQSVDETEYDKDGNVEKSTRTSYLKDGIYNITVEDGEGAYLSDITYYPGGNVYDTTEHNPDGSRKKSTWYYENGQIEGVVECNDQGESVYYVGYYESGQIESVVEYNDQGEDVYYAKYYESGQIKMLSEDSDKGVAHRVTHYYENGQVSSLTAFNKEGNVIQAIYYYENGQVRMLCKYNAQGECIEKVFYEEDGTVSSSI